MSRSLRIAASVAVGLLLSCHGGASAPPVAVGGPKLDLDLWQLTIPEAPLGFERRASLTMVNRGDTPLEFLESGPDAPPREKPPEIIGGVGDEFGVVWPADGLVDETLLPGAAATLTVWIRPVTNVGPREVVLRLYTNDPFHSVVSIPVTTAVIGCRFGAESALDFGHVEPGVPQTLKVTFRNLSSNGRSCDFRDFHLGPGNEPKVFSFREDPPLGIVVAAGYDFSLRIGANVPDDGEYLSSLQFNLDTDGVDLPREIPLTAQGDHCTVKSPPAVNFGPVPVGCSAREQPVVIKRRCDAGLLITSAWLKGRESAFLPGEPFQFASGTGAAWQLPVGYRPVQEGANSDLLYVAGADGAIFVVPLEGEGIAPTHRERFDEPGALDVLFVVDSGDSMAGLQEHVSEIYRELKQALTDHMIDWKIGRLWGSSPTEPAATDGWINQVETADEVGHAIRIESKGSAFIESAHRALIDPALNGRNYGFLRDLAALAIVVVTNRRDLSPMSVDEYVDFFLTRKEPTHRNDIRFAAAAPVAKSPPVPGSGCTYADGAEATLITAVGSRLMGSVEDICDSTSRIASAIAGPRRIFVLSDKPDLRERGSIRVQINGAEVVARSPSGLTNWSYDAARNSVVIDPSVPLPLPTTITVSYQHACPM